MKTLEYFAACKFNSSVRVQQRQTGVSMLRVEQFDITGSCIGTLEHLFQQTRDKIVHRLHDRFFIDAEDEHNSNIVVLIEHLLKMVHPD
jgi:hypothetical protein